VDDAAAAVLEGGVENPFHLTEFSSSSDELAGSELPQIGWAGDLPDAQPLGLLPATDDEFLLLASKPGGDRVPQPLRDHHLRLAARPGDASGGGPRHGREARAAA